LAVSIIVTAEKGQTREQSPHPLHRVASISATGDQFVISRRRICWIARAAALYA
jgi:hypothetical protein